MRGPRIIGLQSDAHRRHRESPILDIQSNRCRGGARRHSRPPRESSTSAVVARLLALLRSPFAYATRSLQLVSFPCPSKQGGGCYVTLWFKVSPLPHKSEQTGIMRRVAAFMDLGQDPEIDQRLTSVSVPPRPPTSDNSRRGHRSRRDPGMTGPSHGGPPSRPFLGTPARRCADGAQAPASVLLIFTPCCPPAV